MFLRAPDTSASPSYLSTFCRDRTLRSIGAFVVAWFPVFGSAFSGFTSAAAIAAGIRGHSGWTLGICLI